MTGFMRKQGRSAQCSPALGILGIIVAAGIVCYVYRQVILTTLITAVLAAVSVAVLIGTVAIVLSTLRWYRRQPKEAKLPADPQDWPAPTEEEAIERDADLLASGVELSFDPDGNLKVKDPS